MNKCLYKIFFPLVSICLFCCLFTGSYATNITLIINEKTVSSEVLPEEHNGVTFVPLRVVSEYLGADVDWFDGAVSIQNYTQNPKIRQQQFSNGAIAIWTESSINLIPGQRKATVGYNGQISGGEVNPKLWDDVDEIELLAAPYLKEGRVMVPLRFIAERMGCLVDYQNGRITIESQQVLTIDEEQVANMLLENNYITKRKDLISDTIKMIEDSRKENISAPSSVKSITPIFNFRNQTETVVASWQFCVPDNISGDEQPFSVLYLHDVLHNIWYNADPLIFDSYFQEGPYLYSHFVPPYYDFEKL